MAPAPLSIEKNLPQFGVKFPAQVLSPPSSALVKISDGQLFLGDVHSGRLYQFDNQLVVKNVAEAAGGAAWLNRIPEGDLVTGIGSFSPTDLPTGSVFFLPKKPGSPPFMLLDSLRRPVHTELADLDADGRFDLVTCEFGKWTGGLSWWKNDGRGHFGRRVLRNSPTLVNAVFAEKYFWDLREPRLDRQMLHVVMDEKEFGTDYVEIMEKLNQSAEYQRLFAEAYPEQPQYQVSTYSISDALTAYVASLTDFDSPFDQYVQGKTGAIDPAVRRGFNLFMGKAACGTCHFAPVFNGTVPPTYDESESEVLGITATPDTLHPTLDTDLGRYANGMPGSKAEFYKTSFKTVTVRNAELTAPYMHNGVFKTLEEVVDFYNRGGGRGLKLEVPHQTLPFDELKLTKAEQADLVAFMKSLTGDMSKFIAPEMLPAFEGKPTWNSRKIGGEY